ncbi:MAG: acyl carrier protein [Spirochaetales bacterium]|nr:acyl carrier protein [Spirochaetales bacterium]
MSAAELNTTVYTQIKDFIVDNYLFGNEENMVGREESFMENGIIDSLGILELIEFCEDTYGISIEDEELIPENLDSLNNLNHFILSKK